MKRIGKSFFMSLMVSIALALIVYSPSIVLAAEGKADPADKLAKANAAFDADKMGDMSEYDPGTWVSPTGDTIKIAIVASFSGPAAMNGQYYWNSITWVAHDINKRGGIFVDGKKKLIEVIKADTMSKPDQAKKVCERMILQEKVHVLWGTDGSNIMKIINEAANKYKVIAQNGTANADDLQNAENFGPYSFQSAVSTEQVARGLAYYYGQIQKQEKKFYILCQDYSFGHDFADGFKKGLAQYYPDAQIVGEDYHKLFLTDFAPYLEKIKASGAEVIFTGDWNPDASNLAKQSRQMGVNLPFAHIYMTDADMLHELGIEGSRGWVNVYSNHSPVPFSAAPGWLKMFEAWQKQWTKWTPPYNTRVFKYGTAAVGNIWVTETYWLLSVIERAKTTNADKIAELWEGDTYRGADGKVLKMRACDHKAIRDLSATVYGTPEEQKATYTIPPYYWFKNSCYASQIYTLPADKVLPKMDQGLDRCKGKNDWGE
ncbi:MAG: ABC transporter substrate-binding protein [Syntrophobacteraceae bacterium]|jgi:ABC-type branched-subunit amino acid transport system substrate-binding protein